MFKEIGNMNYTLIQYDENVEEDSNTKELIWIWAKEYNSRVISIDYSVKDIAKINLLDGRVIEENIIFIDEPISDNFVRFIEK